MNSSDFASDISDLYSTIDTAALKFQPPTINNKKERCDSSACVTTAEFDGGMAVRDSKRPDQQPQLYTADEWRAHEYGILQKYGFSPPA